MFSSREIHLLKDLLHYLAVAELTIFSVNKFLEITIARFKWNDLNSSYKSTPYN